MAFDKKTLDGLRIERPDEVPRRPPVWLFVAIAVLIAASAVYYIVRRPGRARVRVASATAISGGPSSGAVLNASGYVTARRRATVSSKVTGKVVEVLVEEGMHVKQGQVLARLDTSMDEKSYRLAEAESSAAASALEETRVRISQAKLDYDRAASLARQQISSRSDLDRAGAELKALQARLAAQSQSHAVSQRAVALRRQELEDATIRAPFDGVVISKDAQPGEMISPISAGSGFTRTGICTIVDMDSLEIEVDVAEAYINRIRSGQKAEAVLDAYPDWKVPAHVITAIPTADRQKATVKVRIAFDVKDQRILPDMGVKVSFLDDTPATAETAQRLVTVPKAALRRDGEQDIVLVVTTDKVERRAVKVASAEGETVRLASGVNEGEKVVIEGPPDLKDGDAVKVEEAKQ